MIFKLLTLFVLLYTSLHAITLSTMKQESRVALLIANSDYDDDLLSHAVSQADAFNQMLIAQGFTTLFIDDASKRETIKALRKFSNMLRPGGVALFYYQGKVVQYKNTNYFIPIESYIENTRYIQREAISFSDISSKMVQANNRLNIFVIDGTANASYAVKKGFADIHVKNSDIYMVTQPNQNLSKASTFTPNLIELMSKKGISKSNISKGMQRLQRQNQQPIPYIKTTKTPFYFNLPQTLINPQNLAWKETKRINSLDAYKQFVSKYPRGKYASMANDKIRIMSQELKAISQEKQVIHSNEAQHDTATLSSDLNRSQEAL